MHQSLHPLAMTFGKECFHRALPDILVPFPKMQFLEGRFVANMIQWNPDIKNPGYNELPGITN